MSDREIDKSYLTRDEAVKYVRRNYHKGISYRVCATPFVYSRTPDECVEDEEPRGYETHVTVSVSQRQAIQFINDAIGDKLAEKGVRIEVRYYKPDVSYITGRERPGMMFIG